MDKVKALAFTKDRIECLSTFIPSNESEKNTAIETMEYLKFIEKMLEKEINNDEQSRTLEHRAV